MENQKNTRGPRRLRLGLFGLCLAQTWLPSTLQAQVNSGATMLVFNPAHLPEKVLLQAEESAARIFSHAGLLVEIVNCQATPTDAAHPTACERRDNPVTLRMEIENHRPPGLSWDLLGYCVLPEKNGAGTPAAGVYLPAARKIADAGMADLYQALGAAIVHEFGHFLLGPRAHSLQGVMAARWGRQEVTLAALDQLHFTRDQAARMGATIARLHAPR